MDEHTEQNALQGLLSNPALLETLSGLLGGVQSPPNAEQAHHTSESPPTDGDAMKQAAADGIARVLSDPSLMARLPQIMETVKPMLAGEKAHPHEGGDAHNVAKCRNDLLLALKPFLSRERAAAVDAILRISQLGNVLQTLK